MSLVRIPTTLSRVVRGGFPAFTHSLASNNELFRRQDRKKPPLKFLLFQNSYMFSNFCQLYIFYS